MGYRDKIQTLRKSRGDSLRSLGMKIGHSHTTLGQIELGHETASIELLEKIANTYDVPLSYFLVSDELKQMGVTDVSFAPDMDMTDLTADEIRAVAEIPEKSKKK